MNPEERLAILARIYREYKDASKRLLDAFLNQENNIKKLYDFSDEDNFMKAFDFSEKGYQEIISHEIYEDDEYMVRLLGMRPVDSDDHPKLKFRIMNKNASKRVVPKWTGHIHISDINMIGDWESGYRMSDLSMHDATFVNVTPELIDEIASRLGDVLLAALDWKYKLD